MRIAGTSFRLTNESVRLELAQGIGCRSGRRPKNVLPQSEIWPFRRESPMQIEHLKYGYAVYRQRARALTLNFANRPRQMP
jgi:hypothetical protein